MNTNNNMSGESSNDHDTADELVSGLRGGLQDSGIYTSHEKTGPTSGRMKVDLSSQAEKAMAIRSFSTLIESAFTSMATLTTEGQRKLTRERIESLIQQLEKMGGNSSVFRDRLDSPDKKN